MNDALITTATRKFLPPCLWALLGLAVSLTAAEPEKAKDSAASRKGQGSSASPLKVLSYDLQYGEISGKTLYGNSVFHLYFDQTNGAWSGLEINGINLITNATRTFDFRINGQSAMDSLGWKFIGSDLTLASDRRSSRIRFTYEGFEKGGKGNAAEPQYRLALLFSVATGGLQLERSAELTRLQTHATNAVRFEGFSFLAPELAVGSADESLIVVPGPFTDKNFIPSPTPVSALEGKEFKFLTAPEASFGVMSIANARTATTLAIWMETAGEVNYSSTLKVHDGKISFGNVDNRFYLLRPGQTVLSDKHILQVGVTLSDCLAAYKQMVEKTMPAATNAPAWVKEAVILEAMPQYFPGGFKGLEANLPFYREVGFNTLYLMPHWKGGYSPLDPFAVDPQLGTTNELKSLVGKAHELGMKVLFDMVIHGFDEKSNVPKQFPEMFIQDEKGELARHPTWKSITPDWETSIYTEYLMKLVTHDIQDYGIDGYRVDAATFKGPNWDPNLRYPAYRSGTAAPRLLKDVLLTMRDLNTNAVLLSEVFGPLYYGVCDLVHDNMTMGPQEFLELLSSNKVTASHYKNYLSDTQEMLPTGTRRVFFGRNHDTSWFHHFNGYTKPFMALEAVHAFFGIPEVFAGDPKPKSKPSPDEDPEVWKYYRKLFEIRKKYPELTFGNVLLRNIVSSNPNVIAGMRNYKGQSTLVIVSLSDKPEKVSLQFGGSDPMAMLFNQFKWIDALKGAPADHKVDTKLNTILIEPYQVVLGR